MKEDLNEYQEVLENLKCFERNRRLKESKILDSEYDYLEVDSEGFLVEPYPLLDSGTFTYDKVIAAGIELGKKRLNNSNNKNYYEARNEINELVGRKAIYTGNDLYCDNVKNNKYRKVKGRYK